MQTFLGISVYDNVCNKIILFMDPSSCVWVSYRQMGEEGVSVWYCCRQRRHCRLRHYLLVLQNLSIHPTWYGFCCSSWRHYHVSCPTYQGLVHKYWPELQGSGGQTYRRCYLNFAVCFARGGVLEHFPAKCIWNSNNCVNKLETRSTVWSWNNEHRQSLCQKEKTSRWYK